MDQACKPPKGNKETKQRDGGPKKFLYLTIQIVIVNTKQWILY